MAILLRHNQLFFTEQCRFYTENSLTVVVQLDGFSHSLLYSTIEQLNEGGVDQERLALRKVAGARDSKALQKIVLS